MKLAKVCGILFIALFWVNQLLMAQVTTGTISGTVKDSTGAVIPGAAITIRNADTGITRNVTTGEAGHFLVPQLALGNYEITAESAGFQTTVRSGINLTMGREAVVDFTLQVGAVAERITVTGEAPLIETTSSTVSGLVTQTQIKELPLNARSFEQLTFLEPNVYYQRNSTKSTNVGQTGSISAAGMRVTANTFVMDGVDVMDTSLNTPGSAAGQMMGVETLREFRVITNNAPAQYGRGMGAVVDVSSRSGTNDLHGTVFEFLRNEAVDARSFFEPDVQPLKRNQFGFVLGGPIVKDKAFFFGSYEALRTRQTIIRQFIVPTAQAKLGILPDSTSPTGTRTVTVLPAMKPFLAIYPDAEVELGGGLGQVGQLFPGTTREDFITGRVDYQHSQNVSYFGRYNWDDTDKIQPRGGSTVLPWMEGLVSRNQLLILGETRLLSPSLVNEFRAGFVRSTPRSRNHLVGSDPALKAPCCDGQMQLQLSGSTFQSANVQLANIGSTGRSFENWTGNTFQFTDNLSYVRGDHSFKFGANIERFQDNINGRTEKGIYANTVSYQFQGLEQLLAGNARTFSGAIIPTESAISGRQRLFGFYMQDDWRVLSNLTLNLGLRYEWVSNYSNVNDRFKYMNSLFGEVKYGQKYQYAGRLCAGCVDPRFGFAWDIFSDSKTLLKGGFGVFRNQITRYLVAFAGGADAASPGGLSLSVDNPSFPDARIPRTGSVIRINPTGTASGGARILPEIPNTPSALQWNLTLEQAITPTTTARLAYVGSHGYHLDTSTVTNTNVYKVCPDATEPRCTTLGLGPGTRVFPASGVKRIVPAYGGLEEMMYDFNSFYSGFLATLGQRVSHGLDFQLSYAFARATDDVTSTARSGYAVSSEPYMVDERRNIHHGLSGYDMRHRFVTNAGYSFPSLASQNGFASKLLSGWRLNSIITLQKGTPITPLTGFDRANSRGTRPTNSQRVSLNPTLNGPVPICPCTLPASLGGGTQDRPQRYYDPTAFVLPAVGTYGNAGRNIITGPGLTTVDMSLTKNTSISERVNLQFRAEAYNLFNNVNFGQPSTIVFETSGAISSTAGLITSTNVEGRQFQFALKLTF